MKTKIAFTRYECDRCPTKYDDLREDHDPEEEWGRIWKSSDGPLDLCPTCFKSFLEWLAAPKDWLNPDPAFAKARMHKLMDETPQEIPQT